ncbi:MAG: riboflavin synthase [Candidatus Aminicenantales bacterium]|jgi:riboflavin synthase
MFTGIITHQGLFSGYRRGRQKLLIEAPGLTDKLRPGDSVSVDGVCLSLLGAEKGSLRFNLSLETIDRTTLGVLKHHDRVNLELPLTLASPLSGHLVTGHVDAVGKILRTAERRPGRRITVSFPKRIRPFLVPQGSVAVNGVSLTIASLGPSSMDIELIPLTLEGTNLGGLRAGASVNLECDIIGKYVYNWLVKGQKAG